MNKPVILLIAATIVVVLAIGTLGAESQSASTCLGEVSQPPAKEFAGRADCAHYGPDSTAYTALRRNGLPWYITIGSLAMLGGVGAFVAWSVRDWRPGISRALRYLTPGAEVPPRA